MIFSLLAISDVLVVYGNKIDSGLIAESIFLSRSKNKKCRATKVVPAFLFDPIASTAKRVRNPEANRLEKERVAQAKAYCEKLQLQVK